MSDKFTCNKTFPPHPDSLWMSEDQRTAYPEGVTPPTRDSIDNWQMLAGEIIKFAAQDYYDIKVLKALNEVVPDDYIPPVLLRQDRRTVSFFKSRWFACLCGLDPQSTIDAIDRRIEHDLPLYRKEIVGMTKKQLKRWIGMLCGKQSLPDTSDGYGIIKPKKPKTVRAPGKNPYWTSENVDRLKALCDGTLSVPEIARRMERPTMSIATKRSLLIAQGVALPVREKIKRDGRGKPRKEDI